MNDAISANAVPAATHSGDIYTPFYTAKHLALFFIECNGKPISNLIVKLAAGLVTHELRTDQTGALPLVSFGTSTNECTVTVLLPTGIEEIVLNAPLNNEYQCYTCRSPYILCKAETEIHKVESGKGNKPESETKPTPKPVGTTNNTRSAAGNPVAEIVVPEIDKINNLMLVPNEQYRQLILDAYKLSGIMPQAIAALINAESGRKKVKYMVTTTVKGAVKKVNGKLVKSKDTYKTEEKEREGAEWLPTSKNKRSSATGLSQFLAPSWIDQATKHANTHLSKAAVEKGYVVETKNAKGKVVGYEVKDEDALLDMRNEPEYAIYASVEYGMQNISHLIKKTKYKVSKLNDSDKAKLFYLTHHLGIGDALKFIGSTLTDKRAKKLLGDQVTAAKAEVRAQNEKDLKSPEDSLYIFAHRRWLHNFIDDMIKPQRFAHDPSKITKPQALFALIKDIGGVHPTDFKDPPQ